MKKAKNSKRLVLAEGEVTGHAHVIEEGVRKADKNADGTISFALSEPRELVHEEHGTITIPPGEYRSGKVLEYDHAAEEAKQVAD